jgi:hypothetical protein
MDESYTIKSILEAVNFLNNDQNNIKKIISQKKKFSNSKIPPQTDLIINQAENYIRKDK